MLLRRLPIAAFTLHLFTAPALAQVVEPPPATDAADTEPAVVDDDPVESVLEVERRALPPVVLAEQAPEAPPPRLPPRHDEPAEAPPGTHVLVEGGGGVTATPGFGLSLGGVLGVGGKLVGFPLRFYGVAEVGYATASPAGELQSGASFGESRTHFSLALGLRIFVPVFGPLRLFAEGLGGAALSQATLERHGGGAALSASEWQPAATVGAGMQVRVLHELSLGLRLRWLITGDPLGALPDRGSHVPTSLMLTVGWHL